MEVSTEVHPGSPVVAQYTQTLDDGSKVYHRFGGQVREKVEGDPDKVLVDHYCDYNDPENLLYAPVTLGRVLQHGAYNEHATFRYVGEDD